MIKNLITTITFFLILTSITTVFAQKTRIVSGYIEDAASGERLISAAIVDDLTRNGTVTNTYGFFSLSITEGSQNLTVSYIGYTPQTISVRGDTTLTVRLVAGNVLQSVEINAKKQDRIENTVQMSRNSIPVEQIKRMPMLLGEADVLKSLQLLPGVKGGTEGTSGIYVRGGSPDQNLILLDGVPVYNASHIAGLFSVFNADAIRNITLTKGGFPARFGGRLSSVLEIDMKEGNKKAFHTEGSVGLLTSKILVEGLILKDKMSFIVTARRSYLDALISPFKKDIFDEYTSDFKLFFYDLNGKINYKVNDKHNLYLSFYTGFDKYSTGSYYDFSTDKSQNISNNVVGFNYGNVTSALRWNYLRNSQMFVNTTLSYTRYQYTFQDKQNDIINFKPSNSLFKFTSRINDIALKSDVDYLLNAQQHVRFGLHLTQHGFVPGALFVAQSGSRDTSYGNAPIASLESMAYVEDDLQLGHWRVNAGLNLGRLDASGASYTALQPRLSISYALGGNAAIKASYAQTAQFVHLLTNDALSIPSDSWVPSTRRVRPQRAEQVALGIAKTIDNQWELSVEGYYKKMRDLVAYQEGSSFLSQGQDFESRITQGKGDAYGLEVFLQKKEGRTTGWIGYTLAKSTRQFVEINDGKEFPYKYDRRHEFSIVVSHQLTPKISFSANWFFATGNAITLPEQVVVVLTPLSGTTLAQRVVEYGERNSIRTIPTHRLDFGFDFVKKRRRFERKWSIGAYNAYNRANPFYFELSFRDDLINNKFTTKYTVNQISLIPILPYVTYNFKF
jgi:hypothetical protein